MADSVCIGYEPCPECGSKNNLARFDDGHGYCFGCKVYQPGDGREGTHTLSSAAKPGASFDPILVNIEPLTDRCINLSTAQKYGYGVAEVGGQTCHVEPYYDDKGSFVGQKVRTPTKDFFWRGSTKAAALFGQRLWNPGRRIVVTEGAIDAMSVAQAQGLKWGAVSIKNGASGARADLAAQLPWLEAFDEIVLMFDMDEPGRKAALQCAELFTPGKVRIASLPLKDANEMLCAGKAEELVRAVWEAAPYRPEGIVSGVELIERVLQPPPPSLSYAWSTLNNLLRGQRPGEIVTWCGGTGGGKSQVVREIAHALHARGEHVGIIALEESVTRAALAQVALEMGVRLHDPVVRASIGDAAIRKAAEVALKNVYLYEHFGSVEGSILLPRIRYMVKALGVRWVVLDHLSIMVSGNATEGDERKRIDELMTKLRTMVEELQIGVHVVSHLRKAGGTPHEEGGRISMDDLRGSGAIKQISDNIIALERNQQAEDPAERNTTSLRVLKCRLFGETGPAGFLRYDADTGRINEVEALPSVSHDDGGDF